MEIITVELLTGKTASGQLQLPYPDVHPLFTSHTNRPPTLRFFGQNEKIFPNAHTQTLYECWHHKASAENLTSRSITAGALYKQ